MAFAANFGYHVKGRGNAIHPRALQSLLDDIQGTKEQTVLSTMMLRSMKQAKYDAESTGHFGLAAEYYSHFTSPIRRYPDLVIHRVIREVLESGGSLNESRHEQLAGRMADIAQQSSERERVAVDAERDTEALKKAEFMLDKVGEEFEGIISSVTSFGMFIELENTVEGLIRLSAMTDDYYHFDEGHMALIGERTSKVYRIGDDVKVRVANVNMDEHTIDFEMVDMKPRRQGRGEGDRGGNGGRGFGARDGGGRGARAAAANAARLKAARQAGAAVTAPAARVAAASAAARPQPGLASSSRRASPLAPAKAATAPPAAALLALTATHAPAAPAGRADGRRRRAAAFSSAKVQRRVAATLEAAPAAVAANGRIRVETARPLLSARRKVRMLS